MGIGPSRARPARPHAVRSSPVAHGRLWRPGVREGRGRESSGPSRSRRRAHDHLPGRDDHAGRRHLAPPPPLHRPGRLLRVDARREDAGAQLRDRGDAAQPDRLGAGAGEGADPGQGGGLCRHAPLARRGAGPGGPSALEGAAARRARAHQHGARLPDGRRGALPRAPGAARTPARAAVGDRRAPHRPARPVRGGARSPARPPGGTGGGAARGGHRTRRQLRGAEPLHRGPPGARPGGGQHRPDRRPPGHRLDRPLAACPRWGSIATPSPPSCCVPRAGRPRASRRRARSVAEPRVHLR